MTRNEMIEILQQTNIATQLVCLPSEEAIECTVVSPQGISYMWIGMDDWFAYELQGITQPLLNRLQKKLDGNCLSIDDLHNTQFLNLWNDYITTNRGQDTLLDICSFFSGLNCIGAVNNGPIYTILDFTGNNTPPKFFNDYNMFEKAFLDCIEIQTKWEDLSTEDLELWMENIEDYDGIETLSFSDE